MKKTTYFTKAELFLWLGSMAVIVAAFCFFDRESYLTLLASLIGVTSLIFAAKGNPVSQVLMIVFSILYGIISYSFAYYGEMITYLGMTMPMSVCALVSWLRHPYEGKKAEVEVNRIVKKRYPFYDVADDHGHDTVLLYLKSICHSQPFAKHRIRYHQLFGGVSDLSAQSVLCTGVCGKRCGVNSSLGAGKHAGNAVSVRGGMFCGVSGK